MLLCGDLHRLLNFHLLHSSGNSHPPLYSTTQCKQNRALYFHFIIRSSFTLTSCDYALYKISHDSVFQTIQWFGGVKEGFRRFLDSCQYRYTHTGVCGLLPCRVLRLLCEENIGALSSIQERPRLSSAILKALSLKWKKKIEVARQNTALRPNACSLKCTWIRHGGEQRLIITFKGIHMQKN